MIAHAAPALWLGLSATFLQCAATPLPEAANEMGYPTVAATLSALKAQPYVTMEAKNGWTFAYDAGSRTVWAFTPAGYPAYPAVVRRVVSVHGKDVAIKMAVLCEAAKDACDGLVISYQKLNDDVRRRISQGR